MSHSIHDPLLFVKMKARRADEHFHFLEKSMREWAINPYTLTEKRNFKKSLHIVSIKITPTPEIIPMLLGDFLCCLRSCLDQLAWQLAHLDSARVFNSRQERDISFPCFSDPWTYNKRRCLFPATVARVLDSFQPDFGGDAFRKDPIWQLDKLWTLDKHRITPSTHYDIGVGFNVPEWRRFIRYSHPFPDHLEMAFPLAWARKMKLKPQLSIEILFGEAGNFEIKIGRLGEINNFVRNEVIPAFTGFFT